MDKSYFEKMKVKMDSYVDQVFSLAKLLPKEEMFGTTSQLKRAALSVPLNFVEGYARARTKEYKHFLEIAYGSLKESLYLLEFAQRNNLFPKDKETTVSAVRKEGDEIGALLWVSVQKLSS